MTELVIRIPEEAYNLIKTSGVDWLGAEHILDAVSKGTPLEEELEKIKVEIQSIIALADSRGEDTKLAYQCQIVINEKISELKGEQK